MLKPGRLSNPPKLIGIVCSFCLRLVPPSLCIIALVISGRVFASCVYHGIVSGGPEACANIEVVIPADARFSRSYPTHSFQILRKWERSPLSQQSGKWKYSENLEVASHGWEACTLRRPFAGALEIRKAEFALSSAA